MNGCIILVALTGGLSVTPSDPALGAAVVTSTEPGGWLIIGEPFRIVQPHAILEAGKVCVFQSNPGKYGVVLIRQVDGIIQTEVVTVEIRGPPPGPEPDPDPPPPPPPTPGERWLLIIEETGERTPQMFLLLNQIRQDSSIAKHHLRIFDKDGKDENNQPNARLQAYVKQIPADAKLPVLFIVQREADGSERGRVLWKGELPTTLEAVLKILKDNGG